MAVGFGGGGRPAVELAPLIHPGLKHVGLGKASVAAALQVIKEERQLDVFAVVDAGLRAEVDVAEPVAIAAREAAVIPRTHHQHVDGGRAVLLHEVVLAQQALRIFGVVPAAHQHHGGLDVLQVFPDGARLPDFVVSGVVDVQVPERLLVLEVLLVGVGERAHVAGRNRNRRACRTGRARRGWRQARDRLRAARKPM